MAVALKCSNPHCGKTITHHGSWGNRPDRCSNCGWTLLEADELPKTPHPAAGSAIKPPEIFGRYRVIRSLGEGGMGAVFLAHDTALDRQVALKIPLLEAEGASTQEITARFRREARAAAAIQHPNVCPIHDVGEVDGVPYLAMAYVDGMTLEALLSRRKVFTPREAVTCVRRLASALEVGHRLGIVHRDLKPPNVMINKAGEPILLDFGIARRKADVDGSITADGAILGTPHYMSPEQIEGDKSKIGPAVDIYSLGVILYELLTGTRPFAGPVTKVMVRIIIEEPKPPIEHRPDIPQALSDACLKAMAKRPSARFATMGDFSQTLKAAVKSESSVAGRDTQVDAPSKTGRSVDRSGPGRPPSTEARTPAPSKTGGSRRRDPSIEVEVTPAPSESSGAGLGSRLIPALVIAGLLVAAVLYGPDLLKLAFSGGPVPVADGDGEEKKGGDEKDENASKVDAPEPSKEKVGGRLDPDPKAEPEKADVVVALNDKAGNEAPDAPKPPQPRSEPAPEPAKNENPTPAESPKLTLDYPPTTAPPVPPPPAPSVRPPPAPTEAPFPKGRPATRFFGLSDYGTRIAFVIDACRDLSDPRDFQAVLRQLRDSLETLPIGTKVNVFLYTARTNHLGRQGGDPIWKEATPDLVAEIVREAARHAPAGKTPLGTQLSDALRCRPDAIYLLTPDEDITEDDLRDCEPLAGATRVHLIRIAGHERGGTGLTNLEKFSQETKGLRRVIPKGTLSAAAALKKRKTAQ